MLRLTLCAIAMSMSQGTLALAQTGRNGDVSGGLNHQPTKPEVQSRETAGGVAPPAGERQRQDQDIDRLYDKLTGHPRPGSGAAPKPGQRPP